MTDETGRPPAEENAVRLYGEEFDQRPKDFFERMRREHGPVVPVLLEGDIPAWYVIGYREVNHVTSNPGLFARDTRRWNAWDMVPENWSLLPFVGWNPSVMLAEGADHKRRSAAISDALDAVDRTELSSSCERIADQLIDEFAGDGEADLGSQFADRLPPLVMVGLFGVPDSDAPDMMRDIQNVAGSDENAVSAYQRLQKTMGRLAESRRAHPGPDVTSRLLQHSANYTVDELVSDLIPMISAGHLPTGHWIGNTLRLMLVDDQFAVTLQGGRGSVTQALNQVLWEDTPSQNNIGRFAVHACELGGRRIRPGDMLILGWAAANADPQVQPPAQGMGAGNRAHLSFGHGDHGCPFPAPELAEVIARTAIEVLLDRLPDIELAVEPDELLWLPSFWVRRLASLPVRFSPAMTAH
ncbi:cytochrome P450 [Actinomadura madurae]|uniref:cytochrome P450 n=2 Tax=Actinomadura madurae TaxID=1993 RepID=UPI002026117C|nr:cytochrome P450 [Actinomadura madurae]MCP9948392.1 cytochrome P450 [Actinomadura madurae]URM94038.1 cytochrome P450 [Actinomadura madurae]URN04747.1 cytochrome P450 [Actinomadura madurae]